MTRQLSKIFTKSSNILRGPYKRTLIGALDAYPGDAGVGKVVLVYPGFSTQHWVTRAGVDEDALHSIIKRVFLFIESFLLF